MNAIKLQCLQQVRIDKIKSDNWSPLGSIGTPWDPLEPLTGGSENARKFKKNVGALCALISNWNPL